MGDEYPGLMEPIDNAPWFQRTWYRNFGKHELNSIETACLKKLKHLKSESFPQRLIPLDSDGMLHISMNNMRFPTAVKYKNTQPDGHESVIRQYNHELIEFSSLDEYLKKITSGNEKKK